MRKNSSSFLKHQNLTFPMYFMKESITHYTSWHKMIFVNRKQKILNILYLEMRWGLTITEMRASWCDLIKTGFNFLNESLLNKVRQKPESNGVKTYLCTQLVHPQRAICFGFGYLRGLCLPVNGQSQGWILRTDENCFYFPAWKSTLW